MMFGVAFSYWIREGERRAFSDVTAAVFGELAAMSAELDRP